MGRVCTLDWEATRTGRRDMSTNKRKAGGGCWATPVSPKQIDSAQKPHFYRIFFPELYSELLPFPRGFLKHIDHEPRRLASLVGPSENVWSVMLLKDAKGISFQDGWQEFVADHGICEPDFLLFRYDGDLRFTVKVFDETACEKEAAFLATPSQELTVLDGTSAGRREETPAKNTGKVHDNGDAGCISGYMRNDTGNGLSRSYGSNGVSTQSSAEARDPDYHHEEPSDLHGGKSEETALSKEPSDYMEASSARSSSQQNVSAAKEAYSSSDNGIVEQALIVLDEPPEPPERSHLKRTPLMAPKKTSKKQMILESCSSLSQKPTESSRKRSFLLPTLYSTACLHDFPPASMQVNPSATLLVSRRRLVTEREFSSTIAAARSFTSKHPSTLVVMQESYVYRGFILSLPKPFIMTYLGLQRRKLKLWDPSGTPWIVNYVSSQGRGCLSGGWVAFSQTNNLELGDICVFELIRKNEMQVHIFRVVEEVTQPIRVAPQLMLEGPPGDGSLIV